MADGLYDHVRPAKITDLVPDELNANQGTERGDWMLTQSLQKFGAGRSILIDKKGRIIAGNKTAAKFGENGLEDVVVVQTDGTKLVAVQRTDIDLDSPAGRELALADNRVGEVNLSWDVEALTEIGDEVDIGQWFTPDEMAGWDVDVPTDGDWGDESEDGSAGDGEGYTRKIEAPIYEVKGEQPEIFELFDSSKADALTAEIESAILPDGVKEFLKYAAMRHTVFNFDKIAEFYAHSDKSIQALMENSALVVIDFQKAIELGFVKLSEAILDQYMKDYPDDAE